MKDSKPASGLPPARVVAASSSIHSPDGIETTNVAKPLPPALPAVIVAMTTAERESTKIVKPLPRPTEPTRQRPVDRRWLLGAGIGMLALAAAAFVVMNGSDQVQRRGELPDVKADGPGEPARPRRIEIESSEPAPAPIAPTRTPAKRDEPSVQPRQAAGESDEVEPTALPASDSPASSTASSQPSILRHRPTETKPSPPPRSSRTRKPKRKPARAADPKWNPDALFLKKK
jgi:hypothetical protein